MQRALPEPAEPILPQAGESSVTRRVGYTLLLLLVVTGGWVRFSDRIAGLLPGLAAPGQAVAKPGQVAALLELGLAPAASDAAAVQAMQLPAPDATALNQAISRRRVRLVQLPLFERDGATGAAVEVNANGLSRVIRLTAEPVVLTIPMEQVGSVTFRLLGGALPGGVGIGAITLTGPMALPTLAAGQLLQVGVVAQ